MALFTAGPDMSSVEAHPGGDAVEPGLQRGALLEAVEVAPGAHEGLLHRVVRLLGRPEHPVAVPGKRGAVRLQLRAVEGGRFRHGRTSVATAPRRDMHPQSMEGFQAASSLRCTSAWSPTPSRRASTEVGRYWANLLGLARRALRRGACSNSSTIPRSKWRRSRGERLETQLPSRTSGSSIQVPPALRMSSWMPGHAASFRSWTRPADTSTHGP